MAKFDTKATGINKTVNKSGHAAYSMPNKLKLVSQVLTSFVSEKKFYGDNTTEMRDLIVDVIKQDPEFVLKLAAYARREFNMRSVAHVLAAYLAHEPVGKPFARRAINAVSLRGDDITEITAFYLSTFGKPLPASLKKGVADVLVGFDEYTMAKYEGDSKSVKMRDLICLCRPNPKDEEQSAMFKRCIEGKLAVPYTWETELSSKGNTKAVWENLIASNKVGYMALLRNLRNIINASPDNIEQVWQKIENPGAVRKSRQLPFRFLSAYKEIHEIASSRGLDALENAVEASAANLERLHGKTVIAVDESGSMGGTLSGKSKMRYVEVGYLLGMLAEKICDDAIFYTFDTHIKNVPVSHRSGVLQTTCNFSPWGGGTDMYLPFDKMIQDNVKADRIIIFSDNECNSSYWGHRGPVQKLADEYRKKTGCNIWVHAVDLAGYGTQQFYGGRTNVMAGWSDKVLQFIGLAEQGADSIVKAIEGYTW